MYWHFLPVLGVAATPLAARESRASVSETARGAEGNIQDSAMPVVFGFGLSGGILPIRPIRPILFFFCAAEGRACLDGNAASPPLDLATKMISTKTKTKTKGVTGSASHIYGAYS